MLEFFLSDFVLVYLEGDKPSPPRHTEFRQTFLENLAKSQLEFEEVTQSFHVGKINSSLVIFILFVFTSSVKVPMTCRL
jgi:hypothetical protein